MKWKRKSNREAKANTKQDMETRILAATGMLVGLAGSVMAYPIVSYPGESVPVVGATVVVASTGDVKATFLSGSGFYDNYLYLQTYVPGNTDYRGQEGGAPPTGNWIFENHLSSGGQVVDLGNFAAGTELRFLIVSDTHGGGYYDWYTGPGSRNVDGLPHAFVDSSASAVLANGGSVVGFEDLAGLGDAGFEDLRYAFSNTRAVGAPDVSSTAALLGMGLAGLVGMRRRLAAR
jgi:hypothetical protein